MTELSLTRAKAKFFSATSDERAVQTEHMKLLVAHVDECIDKGKKEAFYIVPEVLTGAFPLFNVAEIALWLVRQARRGGIDAKLLSVDPYAIRLRGWGTEDWLDEHQPSTFEIAVPPSKKKLPRKIQSRPKKAPALTTEQASVIAQRGELSSRLKHSMATKYGR